MSIEISINTENNTIDIIPNIIFNRFDLQGKEYLVLNIKDNECDICLHVSIQGNTAYLGCYLMQISAECFQAVIQYVFQMYENVKCIKYENALHGVGIYNESPQRLIELPESIDELHNRLNSKGRYNLRREKRLIEENAGKYEVVFYESEEMLKEVVTKFFEFKKITHDREYGMTPEEYIERYKVSSAYVMQAEEATLAVALSCEQCSDVYFDNFSYDVKYSQFSLGSVMYDIYLEKLIEKGVKTVCLGSDKYDYKKRYGSIRVEAYSGEVLRSETKMKLKIAYKSLKETVKSILKRN